MLSTRLSSASRGYVRKSWWVEARKRTRPLHERFSVCLNAAPALVAGRKAKTLQDGFELAQRTIDSGAAMEKLEQLIDFTKKAS